VTVDDVVFRSSDGRYVVARARHTQKDEPVVLVGDLGAVAAGETLGVTGRYTDHPSYGRRFQTTSFTPIMPSSTDGIARYLGSGLIPGIGPSLAERLVERFGSRTLDVIAEQSARLREVDGIGQKRAGAIAAALRARRHEAETLSFLHAVGIGPALARKIIKRFGDDTVRLVREDPYLAAEEVKGVGFKTADRIGAMGGIGPEDPRRAAGAVLHLLGRGAEEGHVFRTTSELLSSATALDVPAARVEEAVAALRARGLVVVEGQSVYLPPLHQAEVAVAQHLARLARPRRSAGKATAPYSDPRLSTEQAAAVVASLTEGLLVLTGGPGTGKTTTVAAVVAAHRAEGRRVVLCAPTGRAAKRLSDATGHPASTIHRLLEWSPRFGRFQRDRNAPLDAELVLVDEASMLDIVLAERLLDAIPNGAELVLVGDVDQLPPVGPGQMLRELIDSGIGRTVRLHRVFRQARESAIVRGAHAILAGREPDPTPSGTRGSGDLFVIAASEPEMIADRLVAALRRLKSAYDLDPVRDVQVLSPMRRGPLGADKLNLLLQEELNPQADRDRKSAFGSGDKVMHLRNDYEKEVFNGDLGEVVRVAAAITYVSFDGREVQYTVDDLDALSLAYVSTIHKVQGSEFPAVVIVLHSAHHVLLSRPLLYTALTRARRVVVIIGERRALRRAIRTVDMLRSSSHLAARLRTLQLSSTAKMPS